MGPDLNGLLILQGFRLKRLDSTVPKKKHFEYLVMVIDTISSDWRFNGYCSGEVVVTATSGGPTYYSTIRISILILD